MTVVTIRGAGLAILHSDHWEELQNCKSGTECLEPASRMVVELAAGCIVRSSGVREWFSMDPIDTIGIQQIILRLSAAALVGGVVGLNRELHGKAAGFRTLALVTLGSAVATMITAQPQIAGVGADPSVIGRIIQGVMTGIGFLGAGVILRDGGGHVTGLTTAAAIWVCAALGIVCGLGYWEVVGVSVGLVLLVLLLGRSVELAAEHVFKRHRGGPPDPGA